MHGRSITLIIGGGIAAYKTLDLVRRARERGASVRAVLTPAAQQFVTPLSVSVLTGSKAFTELFDLKDEAEIGHIRLSREVDLIIVAPATANLMARMASGLADDLATAVLLAADKPILVAPAMNWKMWEHPATQRNVEQLRADGVHIVGPGEGSMACNEWGVGRMAEVDDILNAADSLLRGNTDRPMEGISVLVTAGPTHEPIDPVRYIANRSSGKQGFALASAAARLGASVTLVTGPVHLPPPPGVKIMRVTTAHEMLEAAEAALPVNIGVFAAAVADWRVANTHGDKIKKSGKAKTPALTLVENPDILATIAKRSTGRPALVIGFAAETENVIAHAKRKLAVKGCDWIVANDVSTEKGVMGGSQNEIHLVTAGGVENWPLMQKEAVAEDLMRRAAEALVGLGRTGAKAAE